MSENWKTDGNCKECRRRNYCSKACKKHKEYEQAIIAEAVSRTLVGRLSNMMRKQMNDLHSRFNC